MKSLCTALFAACFLWGSIATSSALDLRTGLVSYWPLDVSNPDDTTPDLAFGNTLTNVNSPGVVTGQYSNAFMFNGTSSYCFLNTDPNVATNGLPIYLSGTYTICFWVKGAQGQQDKYVFAMASTTNNSPLFLIQTKTGAATTFSNKLDIIIRNTAGTALLNHIKSTSVVFDDTWHHVAVTDNRGQLRMYVDGVLDGTITNYTYTAGSIAFNSTAMGALVRGAVAGFFSGSVDEAAVWERVLTQDEINMVRTNGISTPIPPPIPVFTTQPVGSTVALGDYVALSTVAVGKRPFAYQWYRDGVAVPNATNSALNVTDLTNAVTNVYTLAVTNPLGFAISDAAVIKVLPDAAPNISSNLFSYWPFDVVTNNLGYITPDLYSHNDMLVNLFDPTTNLVAGQFGNAIQFDGVNVYANRLTGLPTYNNTNYTISMWVNGDPLQNDRRIYSEGSTNSATPLFTIGTDPASNGTVSVLIRTDGNASVLSKRSTRVAFDNTWHHLVWVDENGKAKLYVDGVLDESDFSYARGAETLNTTSVGAVLRATVGNYYAGAIDDVAAWSRRLSYTEIQAIRTNGVPLPIVIIPPSILVQPMDQTNDVLVGDQISFTVQANGASPLIYQWRKDGTAISPLVNSTATNAMLAFPSVQLSDAGAYSVVITNGGGAVTSSVVQMTVGSFTPATNGEVLRMDVDLTGALNTQPGFSAWTLGANPMSFNGVKVTVTPIGSTLAERSRTAAPFVTNSPPLVTTAQLYNDFIFANAATDGTGMRVLIERLAPNTQYGLTIWSFDAASTGGRSADWNETSSGFPVVIQSFYNFNGSFLPAHDGDDTLGAMVVSSPGGKLQIDGIRDGGTSFGVFLNAIRLVAHPTVQITRTEIVNGFIQLTIEAQYPNQFVSFEESPDLSEGSWTPAFDGGIIEIHGPISIAQFPISSDKMFYRAYVQSQ